MICEKCGFEYESDTCPICDLDLHDAEPKSKKNPLGTTGLVFGIVGLSLFVIGVPFYLVTFLLLSFWNSILLCPIYVTNLATSVAGMIFCNIAKKKGFSDSKTITGSVLSLSGVISNGLSIIGAILLTAVWFLLIMAMMFVYVLLIWIDATYGPGIIF